MPSKRYAEYIDQCVIFHQENKTFSGNGCLKHWRDIVGLAGMVGAKSALDYGCGKGNQYVKLLETDIEPTTLEAALGFAVDKFDPAVPEFKDTDLTEQRDLVWCTDVMEHIPEEDIDFVAAELNRLARKALFVTVATYPAKKQLPNGENAHVTVKPTEWWEERFAPVFARAVADPEFKFVLLVA